MMRLKVNGREREAREGSLLADLASELGLKPAVTVMVRNGEVIPHDQAAGTALEEGDVIELVRFVGGG